MAMPLRVIDVERTIENSDAGGIRFTRSPIWHVISHTWSADVRAFSNIIGNRQLRLTDEEVTHARKGQSYEALFEAAGFNSHPAYQKLVEFLIILRTEGVRWVWFDAVCINQTDSEEKEHEIQHMGTYYQGSMGCYVLQHGIGKGFEPLLRSHGDDDHDADGKVGQKSLLPRWFSRAWTFQEWVLPPKTTFIIDLASEEYLRRIAPIVLLQDGGGCFCCTYDATISPFFLRKCMLLYADKATKENERDGETLSSAMERMQTCHRLKPTDGPHFRSVPGRSHWYFADDLGYCFLLRLKFHMSHIPDHWDGKEFIQKKHMTDTEYDLTKRLGVKLSVLSNIGHETRNLPLVIREISVRQCSNPEDRVLSVLKLLGVQNAVQVRTGKSLEMQLLQLGKSLVDSTSSVRDQELLMKLCLVDAFGNETPGMSWMPQFEVKKGSWQEGARLVAPNFYILISSFEGFKAEMRCIDVCSKGMLQIEGDVCTGNLICYKQTIENVEDIFRGGDRLSRRMVLEVEGQVVMHLHAHMFTQLEQRSTCILAKVPLVISPCGAMAAACIAFTAPGLDYIRERIPVWLVKVGVLPVVPRYNSIYWLVCVREAQGSPLHKIGYLSMKMDNVSLFSSVQQVQCCIGGLGQGVSKLLLNHSDREK